VRRVLMIAFYTFPAAEVGARRTDRFARYLPRFGWEPVVLTVKEKYYSRCETAEQSLGSTYIARTYAPMPLVWYHNRKLQRCRGRESHRSEPYATPVIHRTSSPRFSLRSQIAQGLQVPDEFNGWIPFGVWEGWKLIRRFQPALIYASAKPVSAHVIGWFLKKLTGLPLVIDFRDIWVGNPWDVEQPLWVKQWKMAIERRLIRDADRIILNTPHALAIYRQRYSCIPQDRFICIPNGYDETDIESGDITTLSQTDSRDPTVLIVHTGTVYGRMDPRALLQAVREVTHGSVTARKSLRIEFYGTYEIQVDGKSFAELVSDYHLGHLVRLNPPVPRAKALQLQRRADALLLFVPETDVAVPAKTYEYIVARRPILALCSPLSATAQVIRETQTGVVIEPQNVDAIKSALEEVILGAIGYSPDESAVGRYNAVYLTQQLSQVFGSIVGQNT